MKIISINFYLDFYIIFRFLCFELKNKVVDKLTIPVGPKKPHRNVGFFNLNYPVGVFDTTIYDISLVTNMKLRHKNYKSMLYLNRFYSR